MDRNCIDETSCEVVDETVNSSGRTGHPPVRADLPRFCTRCGALLPDTANFCTYCGKNRFSPPDYAPVRNFQGRGNFEKEKASYGILSLVLIIAVYSSLLIFPECFFLLVFTIGIASAVLALITIGNGKKGRIPAIITLVLVILPILLVFAVMFMTVFWFAHHPGWEP